MVLAEKDSIILDRIEEEILIFGMLRIGMVNHTALERHWRSRHTGEEPLLVNILAHILQHVVEIGAATSGDVLLQLLSIQGIEGVDWLPWW